jgi:radical SAM superfamily enzyme
MWENLPNDIISQLQKEDRFGIEFEGFHYNVRRNDNGGFIVFRNIVEEYNANRRQFFRNSVHRIVEVQVLPIEQANNMLATVEDVELIGTDPVKVLNGELYLVIGRKMWKKGD